MNDAMQILQMVKTSFDASLTRLLWVMGTIITVAFFVVGIAIPFVVQQMQRRTYLKETRRLEENYNTQIASARKKTDKELKALQLTSKTLIEASTSEFQKQMADSQRTFSDAIRWGFYGPGSVSLF